jgi:pimeloyl-ACP methyl ester carboxylesterase
VVKRLFILLACLLALAPAVARADGIGVVLMHGKQGTPDAPYLAYLSQQIEKAGFMVDRPTMCWSRTRVYDRSILDCMADVDASIDRLKNRGATAFVVAGHSNGGMGAIVYGSRHRGLKGIIALAPAPGPGVVNRPEIIASMQQARTLIAAGHGDEFQSFTDTNTGPRGVVAIQVRATPNIFVSFFDMSGPANIVADASQLTAPILWISGTRDPSQLASQTGFNQAPANPLNRYVQVNAGHMDTPDAAADAVVAWLKDVAKN